MHSFAHGIHIFVDGPAGKAREAVRILFAGETVKPNDPVPAPDLSTTDVHEGYRIVDLDRLLVMKLTAFRLKDRVHLIDMIDVGLIDAATVARMPAVLRPRLEQLLADPNGWHPSPRRRPSGRYTPRPGDVFTTRPPAHRSGASRPWQGIS